MDIAGRLAVVTGGGSGMGRELDDAIRADPLAAYGADGLALRTITG